MKVAMQVWKMHLGLNAISSYGTPALVWYLVHVQDALLASCHNVTAIWTDSLHNQKLRLRAQT